MAAKGNVRRVRPLLLILLWIWAITVAIVLDMFWNVEEFDRIRPRASLYRGMRVAAHKMVGVPVEDEHHQVRLWRGRRFSKTATPEDVETMAMFCRRAGDADVPALRDLALTAKDPLVASNAVWALGRLRAVANDPELVALLSDERKRVRQETILALGKSAQDSGVSALAPLLKDEDPVVRLLAIRAIGEIGGPRAVELLRGVVDRPGFTQAERVSARAALH